MPELSSEDRIEILHRVFSPSSPVQSRDFFFGRFAQLKQVETAIREKGQHVVLYGERGVGKTSFSNILEQEVRSAKTAKITLHRDIQFSEIWTELLRKSRRLCGLPYRPPEGTLDPYVVADELAELRQTVLFVLDEFDSVASDAATLRKFADLVKILSDNLPDITLLFVGIGLNVGDLIGEHLSLERCLRQVLLPRMSEEELAEIVDKGLYALQLRMDPAVRDDVIRFSQGFPHYTHLLAKLAVDSALEMRYPHVQRVNFDRAVQKSIENAHESIRSAYREAVVTTRGKSLFTDVVYACALVDEDELGSFRASDLRNVLERLTGKPAPVTSYQYHLGQLCHLHRGQMLQRVKVGKSSRYRWRNPILRAFIHLDLHHKGLLRKFRPVLAGSSAPERPGGSREITED